MLKIIKSRLIPPVFLKISEEEFTKVLKTGDYQLIQEMLCKGALRSPKLSADFSPFPIILPKNNLKLLKLLTKYGVSLKKYNFKGENIIHLCCSSSAPDILNYLLKKKFSLTKRDEKGFLPLHKAASAGNINIVKIILARHPNQINDKDNELSLAPIHCAVKSSSIKTVNFLLCEGAELNHCSCEGTPFFLAACFSTFEIAEKLLECGADFQKGNSHESTVVSLTRFARNKILFRIIDISGKQLYEKSTETSDTLLHIAIQNSNTEAVAKFIQLGINVNEKNKDGTSAMKMALDKKNLQVISLLMNGGYIPTNEENMQLSKLTDSK